ncbi:uncharacterized protein LOC143279864 isoform X4 [Babylonia areolata]|uniref:uncharacterized protein LOC143279864 isoform X4 n=1 Tax=Babylonia areolata TaxID=304850 RepID=UPI003FD0A02C
MATRVTFVSGTAEVKRREKKDAVEEPMMVASQGHMAGDRGNPYHTLQLDRHGRPVVEETMIVASSSSVTGDRGNPYYSRSPDDRTQGGIESVTPAQPVSYVDGNCTCCPYGYHIDLDFLNFCQDVSDGSTLSNLKRIQRAKRKLRKSMEVMLHQQHQQHGDSATATLASTPPPDVVNSTEASRLINMVQYEQTATHQVLRNIDSSVNATLSTMDHGGRGPQRTPRYTSSDSEDGYSYGPVSPLSPSSYPQSPPYHTLPTPSSRQNTAPPPRRSHHHHYHPSNGDESSHFATSLSTSGRTDSMSSLSSVSTVSSEQVTAQYTAHASGMLSAPPHERATAEIRVRPEPRYEQRHVTSASAMTVEKLAATMATHFPQSDRLDGGESPSSPISPTTTIGKASLAAIREAMAVSLQRMRELEEQVKAIPILQVRISVLKEEKRLLALQLKAKSTGASVRSVGVGDDSVYSPLTISTTAFSYPTASSPFAPLAASPRSPAARVRTVGVGEHSVVEPYLLQPDLPTGFTITDNLVQTEFQSRETMMMERGVFERRLPSLTVSTDQLHTATQQMEARSPLQTHFTINQIQRSSPRPLTRSIGVGEGNVLDSSLQIHEKELRTVIIGGNGGMTGKRNVGVEVRVPTRSVGVSYSCDDARPATRTVGVNVNYDVSNILTTLDFKGESELRMALRGVLQKNVHSVGIQCSSLAQVMHTGVQHEAFNVVSVGCGGEDCRVDVDIRQPVTQRSVGMMAKPETSNRVACTEKDWVLDRGTNTLKVETYNKGSSTETRRTGTTATNTDTVDLRELAIQTDGQEFQKLQMIKTIGVNTTPTPTNNRSSNTLSPVTMTRGVNTKAAELITENFDIDISFNDKAINTPKQFQDTGVNTHPREQQLSFTKVESVDVAGEEVVLSPQRPLTMQEHIIQRGANQASAFIGSTSSSGSLSPTSPRRLPVNESVTRTMRETVYPSPGAIHQTWTSDSSSQQSDLFQFEGGQVSESAGVEGSGGYSRSTVTRTITTTNTGTRGVGDLESGSSSRSGGSYRSTITRTISGTDEGDRIITSDNGGQSGNVVSTFTTSERNAGGGFSSSLGGGEGMQRSTYTKTFISTAGFGAGASSTEGGSQGNSITKTISGGDTLSGLGSESERSDMVQGSTVTRTITTSGYTRRGVGSDDLDTAIDAGDGRRQESKVMETYSTGDSGDLFSSIGGRKRTGITTKKIVIQRTGASSRGHSNLSSGSSSSFTSKTIPSGGTSYLERFGFAKTSNLSAGSNLQTQIVTDQSAVAGSGQSESVSGMSSEAGSVQTQVSGSSFSSQGTEGGSYGTEVEVVQGTAVLQSSGSEPSLQGGQVTLVGGMSVEQGGSQKVAVSSGSLQDMSSGVQSMVTESVVVKRSSSGSKLSKNRHSDGARLSRELGLDVQGAFSGRRVGSVEDFMPDDMRRLMNIEVTGSKSKSRSGGNRSDLLMTKTVKTVTTKRTAQDGKSVMSVTKTITNPDGTVTTVSNMEEGQEQGEGKSLGHLSSAHMDLSKLVSGDTADSQGSQTVVEERSEGRDMKDSGCFDFSMSESKSLEGVDMSAMGSLERKQLKSIMKRSKSDTAASKKGISFAESVVGGTGTSSEEEGTESDDESTTSYDEGSYDGREGDITYQCRDDEAIAQGLPGAKMYDQNIRETYELSEEMRKACKVLADYLVDSTTIQTKQLNANLSVVQEEWFRVSSHKLSSDHQVEDYLSSINEISHRLLDYIVNLVDNNGNAAIHYCVSHCNFDIVALLLDTEVCDVRRPNKAGYTPAMLASLAQVQNDDHRHIILRLFAASDINARAEQTGQTALMLATSQCRTDMVQLLLDAGADCNIQDFDGSTALMCACEHGHSTIVQLLLAHSNCDANIADNENSTALSIAMEAGHKDIGVILYKHLNFSKTASPELRSLAAQRMPSSLTLPLEIVIPETEV